MDHVLKGRWERSPFCKDTGLRGLMNFENPKPCPGPHCLSHKGSTSGSSNVSSMGPTILGPGKSPPQGEGLGFRVCI